MACIHIQGGHSLGGEIFVQGAKNAALPIMAAAVLNRGVTRLYRCPKIRDVEYMIRILEHLGVGARWEEEGLTLDAAHIKTAAISALDAGTMRSSIILLGALLGRGQEVTMPYPGGCTIGARPINWHIEALKKMNVQIDSEEDGLHCRTERIVGTDMRLSYPSVGVTENVILAAVLAEGVTVIRGAAKEPEITDLCAFLNGAGAKISGAGSDKICIEGVKRLHDMEYHIMADRIAAGTYMAAAAAAGGSIVLRGIGIEPVQAVADVLAESGCGLIIYEESIKIVAPSLLLAVRHIETQPHPGFPTDMQSQMMACMCGAYGDSCITEHIFENRYKAVPELVKMGADIRIEGRSAWIHGPCRMKGCHVQAKDLRGGAALVIAGLAADGETIIHGSMHIDRGYTDICGDLRQLGAQIQRNMSDKKDIEG